MKLYIANQIGDLEEAEVEVPETFTPEERMVAAVAILELRNTPDKGDICDVFGRGFYENGDFHEHYWCNHEEVEVIYSESKERAEAHQERVAKVADRNRGLRG